jgi:hypothetical protein
MPIFKIQYKVTALLEADTLEEANALSVTSLDNIAYQIMDGDWIGSSEVAEVEVVPSDKVRDELLKIGNDGTFFDEG